MLIISEISVIQYDEDTGCNNGKFDEFALRYFDTLSKTYEHISGYTCRCRKGCSNTACIDGLYDGQEFNNLDELTEYLYG